MGYSDQKYYSFDLDKYAAAVAFGTSTASGTNTLATPAAVYLPNFEQTTQIKGLEIVCVTAPSNTLVNGLFQLLNGTNTIISSTFTASVTAGQAIYGSYTGTYTTTGTATADVATAVPKNAISSGAGVTLQFVLNTSTASAQATGTWDVYLFNAMHV